MADVERKQWSKQLYNHNDRTFFYVVEKVLCLIYKEV